MLVVAVRCALGGCHETTGIYQPYWWRCGNLVACGVGADKKAASCWMAVVRQIGYCRQLSRSVLEGYARTRAHRRPGFRDGIPIGRFPCERLPKAAEELVQLNPAMIVAWATIQAVAAKKATDMIPIVVPVLADPVGFGFVTSEARPSGNVTGIAPYVEGLPAKQLELAREVVPGATRIGLVDDVNDPKAHPQRREIEAAGKELEIKIVPAEVRDASDIGSAYDALAAAAVEVVVVEQSNMLVVSRKQIAEAAAAKKLPTVYGYREHVEAGGLISYGINLNSCFHRAAYYVDKILKGAKPGDLPVEFPTKVELVINLKTAKALGLTIPPRLLTRADEVIE